TMSPESFNMRAPGRVLGGRSPPGRHLLPRASPPALPEEALESLGVAGASWPRGMSRDEELAWLAQAGVDPKKLQRFLRRSGVRTAAKERRDDVNGLYDSTREELAEALEELLGRRPPHLHRWDKERLVKALEALGETGSSGSGSQRGTPGLPPTLGWPLRSSSSSSSCSCSCSSCSRSSFSSPSPSSSPSSSSSSS
ncbi:unnamed protein product, partial [Prorocentrum cordatum]